MSIHVLQSLVQLVCIREFFIIFSRKVFYSSICLLTIQIIVLIAQNQLVPSIQYSVDYPAFFMSSIGLSLCATGGQLVIYYTIKNFGALYFAIVMTTRQVFSILLSTIIFFHPLSIGQWFGAATVFGTLYYKGARKRTPPKK